MASAPQPWTAGRRITSRDDVTRVLADLNAKAQTRTSTTALAHAVVPADDVTIAPDASRLLPAITELHQLLPWPGGLRRGATLAAVGSTSMVLALLAGAMSDGAWGAVVGMPELGLLAAGQDYRINLAQLALVPEPGPDWSVVVSALIDGVDIIVVNVPAPVPAGTVRALAARARQKGAVLIPTTPWAGSDLIIEATDRTWTGLGKGRGRLRQQQLTIRVAGRGRAAQTRTSTVTLPPRSRSGEPDWFSQNPVPVITGDYRA